MGREEIFSLLDTFLFSFSYSSFVHLYVFVASFSPFHNSVLFYFFYLKNRTLCILYVSVRVIDV